MTTGTDTYRRDLVAALRAGNVPPERIGEIVAEVESHVADTGEDPREAFGPAREYAAGFAVPPSTRSRVSLWALVALGAGCGWLIAEGVFGVFRNEPVLGLPEGWALAAGWLLWIPAVAVQARRHAPVRDPRTGRSLTPGRGRVVLAMTVFLLLLMLVTALAAALTGA
ncbi:HAAS signaling domain-containing protein [Geodermatophilus sp. SYSU D00766]